MRFPRASASFVLLLLSLASTAAAQQPARQNPYPHLEGITSVQVIVHFVSGDDEAQYLDRFNVKAGAESKLRSKKISTSDTADARLIVNVLTFTDKRFTPPLTSSLWITARPMSLHLHARGTFHKQTLRRISSWG
jgi:hypothetical protein